MEGALAEQARKAAEYKGRTSLGTLTRNDIALIVVPAHQDREILQVVLDALKEKGISADVLWEHDLSGIAFNELVHGNAAEGWKELLYFQPSMAEFLTSRAIASMPPGKPIREAGVWKGAKEFLRKNPKYTALFMGTGGQSRDGGHVERGLEEQGSKWRGYWDHINRERFLSKFVLYPSEIVDLLDLKILESASKVEEIRVTDPAGTYFTCPVSEQEASIWARSQAGAPWSHAIGYPLMGYRMLGIAGTIKPTDSELVPIPKSNGVIAGTCGHYGYYPHMKAYLRDGWIERIEGGGRMGDLLQEILVRTRDIQYPGLPGPGWLYLNGIAVGTIPKGFRNKDMFDSLEHLPNSFDRLRSGVIHWDMGGEHYSEAFSKFTSENKLPARHSWHIHTYFNTYEVRFRGSTEWHKIIDKGHLTTLDDPKVRAVAAKYGAPGELLKEDWIPPIPGINYPGDYMRDYGNDPASWVWKEVNGLLPETIGVPPK